MTWTLHHGDCRDVLATMDDASVDAVVTDPPYELGFMGKAWDAAGVAYDAGLWCEVLRVLKPGGHLLAFGGTRTYHRMTVAIEDAGFEVRDSIHWVYGSGFPKSLDVSKAIDKRGGNIAGFEQFRDATKDAMTRNKVTRRDLSDALGNHMLSHYLTAGSQPAVPNYRDYVIIRDTVGLGDTFDHLFAWEAEREVVGVSPNGFGPNKGSTLTHSMAAHPNITAPATDAAREWDGWGTALKPAHEPIVVARKPLAGTVAATVLAHGTGALNIDGCRVGYASDADQRANDVAEPGMRESRSAFGGGYRASTDPTGRWPANFVLTHAADCGDTCAPGCPVAELDAQSGEGASRFFTVTEWDEPPFLYVAKPSRAERNAGAPRNIHPTVKPLDLMRWLVRLVTPPGGVVLDPFAGSGTTLAAAILEGFHPVGVEMTDDYLPIIDGRCAWAERQARFGPVTGPTKVTPDDGTPSLFDEVAS